MCIRDRSPRETGKTFKENSLINSQYFSKKTNLICLADDSGLEIDSLNKKIACVVGKVEGYISKKPKGKNGFGYDPIFIPKNKIKTFGEMKPFQKYKLDHRSDAFKKLRKFL